MLRRRPPSGHLPTKRSRKPLTFSHVLRDLDPLGGLSFERLEPVAVQYDPKETKYES
jgi:hypothetical protein